MAAPAPSPPAPGKGGLFKRLDPKQRRIAIALAAGGLLALFVMLRRGGGGGGGTDTAAAPISPTDASGLAAPGAVDGSTFADNGASFGELNTTLSGLSGQLDALLNQPAPFIDPGPLDAGVTTPVQDPAVPAPPGVLGSVGGVRAAAAALKSKVVVKPSAAHGGQASVYRFVDTDPKKAGYEQKVYLRPASTAKPAARAQPAPKPAAAPKPQTIVKPSAAHGGKLWVYHVYPGRAPVAVRPATAR
jgi:hypothetical protein